METIPKLTAEERILMANKLNESGHVPTQEEFQAMVREIIARRRPIETPPAPLHVGEQKRDIMPMCILSFFLPLVGLIVGCIWMSEPTRRDDGKSVLQCAFASTVLILMIWMLIAGAAS